jgi:hypothetical protein
MMYRVGSDDVISGTNEDGRDNHSIHDGTLSSCLRELIPSDRNKRWSGLLSVIDSDDLISSASSTAILGARDEIPRSISGFLAESLCLEMFPAIMKHHASFEGDRAFVHIAGPRELQKMWQERTPAVFPDEAIKLNLDEVKSIVEAEYRNRNAHIDHMTLYVLKVHDTYHHLLAVTGDLHKDIEKCSRFLNWRDNLKKNYGLDICFNYSPYSGSKSTERLLEWKEITSPIETEYSEPMPSKRTHAILKKLCPQLEDWTNETFLSIDSVGTTSREDIISARFLENNSIEIKICEPFGYPFQAADDASFRLYQKTFALGKKIVLSEEGEIEYCKINPVIAKNVLELTSEKATQILNEKARDSTMLAAMSEAALRNMKRRLNLGSSIELPLPAGALTGIKKGDMVVGELLSLGQRMLTEWMLCKHPHIPILVMRPDYKFGEDLNQLIERCPWIRVEHLQDLSKRKSLTEILALEGDDESLLLLRKALQVTACSHKVVAIDSIDQFQAEDMFRFKRGHPPFLGPIGQAQIASVFFGTPHYSFKELKAYAPVINLTPKERSGLGRALSLQIQKFNNKLEIAWLNKKKTA